MVNPARLSLVALAATGQAALAADGAAATPGPGLASVLQVSLGLAIVLAMVAAAAWLIRRLGVGMRLPDGVVRMRGGIAIGQRERVVVVEIRDTWLVIGVAPGQVRTLHALPKPPESEHAGASSAAAETSFARWLSRTLEKQRA